MSHHQVREVMEMELQRARERVEELERQIQQSGQGSSRNVGNFSSSEINSQDFQDSISDRINSVTFAPYGHSSQVSAGTSTAGSSSQTNCNIRRGYRARTMTVPNNTPSAVPKKKRRTLDTETVVLESMYFQVLGDPKERKAPDADRVFQLEGRGLSLSKLTTASNGSAAEFRKSFEIMTNSIESGGINCLWDIVYATSIRRNAPLHLFDDPEVTWEELKSLKKQFRVVVFYLRPRKSVVPLVQDEDTVINSSDNEDNEEGSFDTVISDTTPDKGTIEMFISNRSEADAFVQDVTALISLSPDEFVLRARNGVLSTARVKVNRNPNFPTAFDVLECFQQPDLNPHFKLFVSFEGESGIDAGALTKEFFWSIHRCLQNELVFGVPLWDGREGHRGVSCHEELLAWGGYVGLANIMLHSFMNIGILAPGMSRPVFEHIVGCQRYSDMSPNDCPEHEDQVVASTIFNVLNNSRSVSNDELLHARSALEKLNIRGPINHFNAEYNLQRFCENATLHKRQESLSIIRDIIAPTVAGQYLRANLDRYSDICPGPEKFNPSVNQVIKSFENRKDPSIQHSLALIQQFLENIEDYSFTVQNFLEFVTASPILTSFGMYIINTSTSSLVYSKTCLHEIYIPENIQWDEFQEKMKESLDPRNQNFLLA